MGCFPVKLSPVAGETKIQGSVPIIFKRQYWPQELLTGSKRPQKLKWCGCAETLNGTVPLEPVGTKNSTGRFMNALFFKCACTYFFQQQWPVFAKLPWVQLHGNPKILQRYQVMGSMFLHDFWRSTTTYLKMMTWSEAIDELHMGLLFLGVVRCRLMPWPCPHKLSSRSN